MRHIIILTALALLLGMALHTMTADEVVSKDVQEVIDLIKELNGQYALTPENTLKTITITNGSDMDSDIFDLFTKQTDLELLHIADYRGLNDALVAKLTGLKKLKTLRLTNSGMGDASIKTIAGAFPDLVELDISRNARLTDAATKEIAKLKNLEILGLLFCDLSEFGILNIKTLPKLRALDIRGNMKIGDGGMRALAMSPTLRSLKHRSPAVSDDGIRALAEAKSLDNLEIQDLQITGQAGQYIRQMEKLTGLIIFRCENFDSSGVRALSGLKLNRLTLRGLPIDDTAMEVFRDLPTIKRLYLNELPSVSDIGILNIAHLKDLEILEVWEVPLTDKSMETIAKFASLKTLILRGTKITDAGLDVLITMPKLESVTLVNNAGITPEKIQKLRDAKKFTVLPPLPQGGK
jgi:Leucine-rich repeat (LRR) protein